MEIYGRQCTYHKQEEAVKKFLYWGKHPEIYLYKENIYSNKNIESQVYHIA